jgi:hypothetical protein
MFRDESKRQGLPNIEITIRHGFLTWSKNHVSVHRLRFLGFFSPDSDICVFHVGDHAVEE